MGIYHLRADALPDRAPDPSRNTSPVPMKGLPKLCRFAST